VRSLASDRRVFVDISAYYAATDRRDAENAATIATMRRLTTAGRPFITTNAVLFELHGFLVNRVNRQIALRALVEVQASQTVVRVRERDEDRAGEILAQYDDNLTDALSFAVMERLGIRTALTLDRHFAQFGWQVVPIVDSGTGAPRP
jgi:uncharacterized protein